MCEASAPLQPAPLATALSDDGDASGETALIAAKAVAMPLPLPLSLAIAKPNDAVEERLRDPPPAQRPPRPPHSNGTGESPGATPPQEPTPAAAPPSTPAPAPDPRVEPPPPDADDSSDASVEPAAPAASAPPSVTETSRVEDAPSEPVENGAARGSERESSVDPERSESDDVPVVIAPPENGPRNAPAPESRSAEEQKPPQTAQTIAPSPRKKTEVKPKSTLKLATLVPTMARKRKSDAKPPSLDRDGPVQSKRPREDADGETDEFDDGSVSAADARHSKRNRTKVQPYQSPTPELAMVAKLSAGQGRSTPTKQSDDKLIVFYKNEFLAVRNAEGGFYVCQTMQNVYRSSRKIKIRWLSQEKSNDPAGEIYKPDFYDVTDIECVLTTLSLQRVGSAGLKLGAAELARTQSILGRALAAERGEPAPETNVTEEHPDGLDLSLYKDESQLEKKKQKSSRKRSYSKSSLKASKNDSASSSNDSSKSSPKKRSSLSTKKRKTKSPSKTKLSRSKTSKKSPSKDKQNSNNSPPTISASTTNKTATASGKVSSKGVRKSHKNASGRNSSTRGKKSSKVSPKASAAKVAQLASTPSTSTGKTTRTPRKPPSKK